ncbi:MAG: phosphatase PAP2 family protein [Lachnospiraceae bacterium]|nr:phosphatase PAP2 family protein [Lachnospiraceae bacterium]
MDIQILLLLQQFRDGAGSIFADFLAKMTFLAEINTVLVIMAVIYWCVSKEIGTYLLMGWSGNRLVNGLLKVSVCAYRPWIRDSRIIPYKDLMKTATGYSFPSGHTTNAATLYGGAAIRKDIPRTVRIILACILALVAFSRIYLGVHTPQDILAGTVFGLLIMWLTLKLMAWVDSHPEKDWIVACAGIAAAGAIAIYAAFKSYPVDYDNAGNIIVDGAKMAVDTYKNVGLCAAFLTGWILERRYVRFSTDISNTEKLARLVIGLPGYYAVSLILAPSLREWIPGPAGVITAYFIQMFFVSFIFPWCVKLTENADSPSAKTHRVWITVISLVLIAALLVPGIVFPAEKESTAQTDNAGSSDDLTAAGNLSRDGYELEQVVVLSRHNIRAPLSGKGSVLQSLTPHEWFAWSSNASELSLRGGVLETEMGQYFRKWLESEGLFPENYHPEEGEVRIYANSKQRTIATSEYFVSGLLPTANISIETHGEYDKMNPVFNPQLTFVSPEYAKDATDQIWEFYTDDVNELADNFELLTEVVDMEDSEAWKKGEVKGLRVDDTDIILNVDCEPEMTGSLKNACSLSDALILQYYEESDPVKAAFGHELSDEQWKQISEIKDVYGDVLFTAPLIAPNVAHPLLEEIRSELTTKGRVFTFLCGHDSNIGSVLAALGADDYELPDTIEGKTPIGSKIVFCRWRGTDGKIYCTVDMVYQTTKQLQGTPLLDLENHPCIVPLHFSSLTANDDGMYEEQELLDLFEKSIAEYDRIVEDYTSEDEAEDAA